MRIRSTYLLATLLFVSCLCLVTPLSAQETVTDIDGNVYKTVKIGTQTWLAENMKTTRYRNGDAIPNVIDNEAWRILTTGAYCNYNNDVSNATTYGRLYNWYAVNDSRNIAPTGWHVPTDAEWAILTDYLGGLDVAGGKIKELGTLHWTTPNKGATNETGFTAFPSGSRDVGGTFGYVGLVGYWWSSTENNTGSAWYRSLYSNYGDVLRYLISKSDGFAVRCVRD